MDSPMDFAYYGGRPHILAVVPWKLSNDVLPKMDIFQDYSKVALNEEMNG